MIPRRKNLWSSPKRAPLRHRAGSTRRHLVRGVPPGRHDREDGYEDAEDHEMDSAHHRASSRRSTKISPMKTTATAALIPRRRARGASPSTRKESFGLANGGAIRSAASTPKQKSSRNFRCPMRTLRPMRSPSIAMTLSGTAPTTTTFSAAWTPRRVRSSSFLCLFQGMVCGNSSRILKGGSGSALRSTTKSAISFRLSSRK